MNRRSVYPRVLAALSIAALVAVPSACGQAPVDNRKMALQKTYIANQVTSFTTGQGPSALAFDGEHIWVANSIDNTVMKFNTNTGQLLGTFRVGNDPEALAFDGFNIWVANLLDGTVMKLRASDGRILGAFPYLAGPGSIHDIASILFDGSNIWVLSMSARSLTKFRASDGLKQGTFDGGGAGVMAFDSSFIWLAMGSSLVKVRTTDGSHVQNITVGGPIGDAVTSLTFDGTYLYAGGLLNGDIKVVRSSDGTILNDYCAVSACPLQASTSSWVTLYPAKLAFDGSYIWSGIVAPPAATALGPSSVTAVRTSDGSLMGTFYLGIQPAAIAFDGTNIWVADNADNLLIKL